MAFFSQPSPQRQAFSSLPRFSGKGVWAFRKKDVKDIAAIFDKALILNKCLDSQQNRIEATDISHVPSPHTWAHSPLTTSRTSVAPLFPMTSFHCLLLLTSHSKSSVYPWCLPLESSQSSQFSPPEAVQLGSGSLQPFYIGLFYVVICTEGSSMA